MSNTFTDLTLPELRLLRRVAGSCSIPDTVVILAWVTRGDDLPYGIAIEQVVRVWSRTVEDEGG